MLTACPNCDSFVPMNVEVAVHASTNDLICPCCERPFNPFDLAQFNAELGVEELKDNMIIERSLQNTGRWFEDC